MMTGNCPEPDQLQRFILGDRSETEPGQLEDHIRQCSHCQQRVAGSDSARQSAIDSLGQTLTTLADSAVPSSSGNGAETLQSMEQLPAAGADRGAAFVPGQSLHTLKPGDQLDKYLILDVLGRGGMGIVFKARDTILDRIVAIKIPGALLSENPAARKRFIREGQTAAAVKDQHVVTVYGVEGHETAPYLVLEYVEGRSLEELLAESAPLPVDDVVNLGVQIAQGLAAAHQKGLIHRDIKPANILLEKETGRVAITDFGLARAVDDGSISRSGEVCGTPHYMAPEQVEGGAIDHRADLFSLGSVLYYMCTGELPFAAPHSMAVLHRVYQEQPRPIQECNRCVPEWLIELINALHAKDPDHRIQSAAAVKEALSARRGGAPTATLRDAPAKLPANNRGQASPGFKPAFALVLGFVFLLSLPAFYFMMPREEDDRKEPLQEHSVAETKPQSGTSATPRDTPKGTPSRPSSPKRQETAEVVPPRTDSKRPEEDREVTKPKPVPQKVKGIVVVLVNDAAGSAFFRDVGLTVRGQNASEVVTLNQGRNDIPLGEYKVEEAGAPAGIKIVPRRFTVTANTSAIINITGPPPPDKSPMPPGEPPPPPPGRPPFPPPPGGPPRR